MNKKLLSSVREYKKQSVLAPILVILEVLMEVLIPLEMAKIIDVGIANGDMSYIIQRGVILVAMAMISLFFGVQAGNMAAVAAAGYAKNLRHDIFYKVQDFSFKNIDHFSTSGLVTRLTTDITNVQQAYMMSIRLLARAPFMIILSWIMTLTINKPIAVLFLIVVPVLGGTLIFIAKKAHPHFIKVFDEYDNLNNSVQENVNASRVVKAFVREDYEIEKFHGISRYVYDLFTKAEKIVAWNSPVMMFAMYTVIIIIVAIGGRGIVLGGMETGELTSIIVYALQILMSLNMVTFVFVMIMIAEASTDRIVEVLDEVPEMQDKADAVKNVADGSIDFNHVDFSYAGEGGNLSLKDVNLHIKSGQTVGIIGGTGSGKSTLVSLIPRFYDPQEGTVKVNGVNAKDYPQGELCSEIGVVQQRSILFKGSIRDNLKWGNDQASDEDLWKAITIAQAKDVVEAKPGKLDFEVEQNGRNLSGGQKQRVGIARALTTDPELLLCDEATSALDPQTTESILKLLKKINRKMGVTILLITHQMQVVQMICNKVAVMESGKIVESGSVLEVFGSPKMPVTKRFVQTVIRDQIPDSIISLVKEQKENFRVDRLKFIGSSVKRPVISDICKTKGVVVNILGAAVQELEDSVMCVFILQLIGDDESIDKAEAEIDKNGVLRERLEVE